MRIKSTHQKFFQPIARIGYRITIEIYMVLLLLIPTLPAEATEKDSKSNRFEPFQEEVDMLEDAEFPDLLSVDDTSELMDEFELLQEESLGE